MAEWRILEEGYFPLGRGRRADPGYDGRIINPSQFRNNCESPVNGQESVGWNEGPGLYDLHQEKWPLDGWMTWWTKPALLTTWMFGSLNCIIACTLTVDFTTAGLNPWVPDPPATLSRTRGFRKWMDGLNLKKKSSSECQGLLKVGFGYRYDYGWGF